MFLAFHGQNSLDEKNGYIGGDNDNDNECVLLPCNTYMKDTTNHIHENSSLPLSFGT